MIATFAAGAAAVWIGYAWRENRHVVQEDVSLTLADRLDRGKTISVLQLSDLHFSSVGARERRLLVLRERLHPDLVVFTGDWLALPHRMGELLCFVEAVVGGVPAFGVWGNLERWRQLPLAEMRRLLSERGIKILVNEHATIMVDEQKINIAGVDDPHYHFDDVTAASSHMPRDGIRLLLAHSPNIVSRLSEGQFDVVLCGHTHGGQICLPWLGPVSTAIEDRSLARGLHVRKKSHVYINRGLGFALLPLRFRCPPEATMLYLKG